MDNTRVMEGLEVDKSDLRKITFYVKHNISHCIATISCYSPSCVPVDFT